MGFADFEIRTFHGTDGAGIRYVDAGSGKAMMYIMGFGSSIESQAAFIEAMQEKGRIIAFDQRAFGMTPAAGEMGIHQSARDAKALLEYLGIEDITMFGYSMGAAVIFSYVRQFGTAGISRVIIGDMSPKLINEGDWRLGLYQGWYTREMFEKDLQLIKTDYKRFALIVAEGLLFQNDPENVRDFSGTAEDIRARILGKRNDLIAQVLIQGMVDVNEEHAKANYYYWETMAGADFRDVLPAINVPTVIMYADPGSGYSPAAAEYMKAQIPDAVLMPMYDCTHMAAAESPKQWRGCIEKFAYR